MPSMQYQPSHQAEEMGATFESVRVERGDEDEWGSEVKDGGFDWDVHGS